VSQLRRIAVALLAVAVITGTWVVLVRWSNGDFSGRYALAGYFPDAGQGLHPGSEVVFRGVQVGQVSTLALAGSKARVTMLMNSSFRVPADATATIEPVNLFGADEVSLSTPGGGAAAPFLAAEATLARTADSDRRTRQR
jgi:phospholipid/cholesterol/gamma-HCH transport system substrate-binding protein